MSDEELNVLHKICDLEATQMLIIFAMSVKTQNRKDCYLKVSEAIFHVPEVPKKVGKAVLIC